MEFWSNKCLFMNLSVGCNQLLRNIRYLATRFSSAIHPLAIILSIFLLTFSFECNVSTVNTFARGFFLTIHSHNKAFSAIRTLFRAVRILILISFHKCIFYFFEHLNEFLCTVPIKLSSNGSKSNNCRTLLIRQPPYREHGRDAGKVESSEEKIFLRHHESSFLI